MQTLEEDQELQERIKRYWELRNKQKKLKTKMLELFEFAFEMFSILQAKGILSGSDFDIDLRQKAQAWKTLLNEIKVLESREERDGVDLDSVPSGGKK